MILLGGSMDMYKVRKFVSNNYSVSKNKKRHQFFQVVRLIRKRSAFITTFQATCFYFH